MDSKQAGQYLERLGFLAEPEPTLKYLSILQKAHLLNVPFENLDIGLGIPITLDIDRIFKKIVTTKRGGFCYELNALFGVLLRYLGFDITQLAAQVYNEPKGYGLPFAHLALCAKIDKQDYLTDVGFGDFAFAPLRLVAGSSHQDSRGIYTITQDNDKRWVVSKDTEGLEKPEYAFYLQHRELDDYADMCIYTQTSPDSPFTQKRLISRATENGRITITQNTLLIKRNNQSEETTLETEADFAAALSKYFSVSL